MSCHFWDSIAFFVSELISDFSNFIGESICCTNKHIVTDVIKVTTESKPRTRWRNMICGAFTFCFQKQLNLDEIFSVPSFKWLKKLQSLTLGVHYYLHFTWI